jgi:uncharacterized protein
LDLDISVPKWSHDDLEGAHELKLGGAVSKIDEGLLRLNGTIAVVVPLSCGRCLKSFDSPVELQVDEIFSREPETEQWGIGADNLLDLREPLRQQILLALPTHPLCSPDCEGLCQVCGQELRVCHHNPNRDTLSSQIKLSKLKD